LTKREFAGQPIGVAIEVSSVDGFVARVAENGGAILAGKGALPGAGWFAVCQDPDGNTFVIFQPEASASLEKGRL
jgi:predicted enzyme related to lactoylglutathione lyase